MNITNETLKNVGTKYYGFAYALVPDEMMATQLLIDSITKLTILYREDKDSMPCGELLDVEFLKNVFSLSIIRSAHFLESRPLESFGHREEENPFFLMELKERACLFLKDKLKLSFNDTSYILEIKYDEVLAIIHRSRSEFLDLLDYRMSFRGAIHGIE